MASDKRVTYVEKLTKISAAVTARASTERANACRTFYPTMAKISTFACNLNPAAVRECIE